MPWHRARRVVVTDDFPAFFLPPDGRGGRRALPCGSKPSIRTAWCRCAPPRRAYHDRVRLSRVPAEGASPAPRALSRARAACRAGRPGESAIDAVSRCSLARGHRCAPRPARREALAALADRPHRRAGHRPRWHARRPARSCRRSSTRGCGVTSTSATSPTTTWRAACRPTCTSATSRRTRSSARAHDARRLDDARGSAAKGGGQREGWWGVPRAGRVVPRRADHVARARLRDVSSPAAPTTIATSRCPTGRSGRSARTPTTAREHRLHARRVRATPRRTTRCGTPRSASCVRDGTHPQLPAHALGQEDPRVVARRHARRSRP